MTADADPRGLKLDALAGGERARSAFERLWLAYFQRLLVFAATYRGLPRAEREDAAVDALVAAFTSLGDYDAERPLAPWVYRIASNRFADAARRSRRESSIVLGSRWQRATAYDPPDPARPDRIAEERDLVERCRLAVDALPDVDRRIAQLRFYEGLDASGIGEILGMAPGTVRWRLAGIRRALAWKTGGMS